MDIRCCQSAQGTPNTGIARSKGRLRPFPLRGAPWPAKAGAFAHADRGGPKTLCSPILIPQFATLAKHGWDPWYFEKPRACKPDKSLEICQAAGSPDRSAWQQGSVASRKKSLERIFIN